MAKRVNKSVVVTARISPTLSKKLDGYAKITGNTKSRCREAAATPHRL
jgi:hypothetical protein